jgi:hypothetical protein
MKVPNVELVMQMLDTVIQQASGREPNDNARHRAGR